MPWIQHYSRSDVLHGIHFWDEKTALIQIKDIMQEHVKPALSFTDVLQLEFEDVEEDPDEIGIRPEHADQIVSFLRMCKEQNKNIVVHCHAGICRSSAVAMVAQKMGFDLDDKVRLPNKLVMHRLFVAAGM
jgi:predicted protein tyrosine phosphatase